MFQVLSKIAERVIDPIHDIKQLALAGIAQIRRTQELEAKVDRLARVVIVLGMQQDSISQNDAVAALTNLSPVDLSIVVEGEDDEFQMLINITQGERERVEDAVKESPMNFGRVTPPRSVPRG